MQKGNEMKKFKVYQIHSFVGTELDSFEFEAEDMEAAQKSAVKVARKEHNWFGYTKARGRRVWTPTASEGVFYNEVDFETIYIKEIKTEVENNPEGATEAPSTTEESKMSNEYTTEIKHANIKETFPIGLIVEHYETQIRSEVIAHNIKGKFLFLIVQNDDDSTQEFCHSIMIPVSSRSTSTEIVGDPDESNEFKMFEAASIAEVHDYIVCVDVKINPESNEIHTILKPPFLWVKWDIARSPIETQPGLLGHDEPIYKDRGYMVTASSPMLRESINVQIDLNTKVAFAEKHKFDLDYIENLDNEDYRLLAICMAQSKITEEMIESNMNIPTPEVIVETPEVIVETPEATALELENKGFEIIKDAENLFWINEKSVETGYLLKAHGSFKTFNEALKNAVSLKNERDDKMQDEVPKKAIPKQVKVSEKHVESKKSNQKTLENITRRDSGVVGTIQSYSDALLKAKRENPKMSWTKAYVDTGLLRQDGYKVRRSDYFQSQLSPDEQNWILKAAKSAQ